MPSKKPHTKPKKLSGATLKDATLAAEKIAGSKAFVENSGKRSKKIRLAEALYEEGIDVRKIAKGYAGVHNKLSNSKDKGDLKLFVDVLKENTRILEPPRPTDRSSSDAPVTVILKHNVPRPAR